MNRKQFTRKVNMKNSQENRTELVRRALISLIIDSGMKPGDKLPPQAALRQRLGVGSATIASAIKTFVDDNILEIKPNNGVFLASDDISGYIGRRIGVVNFRISNYPSGAMLQQCLREQFVDHACLEIPFIRNVPDRTLYDSLSMYGGLSRAIENGGVDGLISTVSFDSGACEYLKKYKIPVCSLDTALYPYGAVVCSKSYHELACKLALERGFKRPAMIALEIQVKGVFRKCFAKYFPSLESDYCKIIDHNRGNGSQDEFQRLITEAISELWNRPADERPDCLIIPDDIIASAVYMYLCARTSKIPHFIYERCEQLPFFMPPEVIGDYFYLDHSAKAKAAVELLLDIMNGKKKMNERIDIKIRLITKEEQLNGNGLDKIFKQNIKENV